ncbi:hypothetical protein [Sphingobium sp. Ant17]|uniref:hypothetical protein n=1 Tax=Sphingobium sp. Ant17 TaxID=1461752 RepID=UPI0006864B88|nr:hypothetical protein [Sphingobium sp. Ant17]
MAMTLLPPGTVSRRHMAILDGAIVARMSALLPAQTERCVMQTFGISVNTWVKVKQGQPIRPSVANRLIERLQSKWSENHV